MATTTPNFGWSVPTSTDLVKDGATAIELLGDSIDASLVDLKGGTTGQVLSKASNADMDFTWVTDAAGDITGVTAGTGISGGGTSGTVTVTNSMATAIDAKGDLIGGTGADTFARLAVGANGTVLTADSAEATGLKWSAPSSGGMTLLSTTTASGSSTSVSITPTGYNEIIVICKDLTLTTDGDLFLRINNDTTASNYNQAYQGVVTNTNYVGALNNVSGVNAIVPTVSGYPPTAGSNIAQFNIPQPNDASRKLITAASSFRASGSVNTASMTVCNYTSSAAISSVQAFTSAGSFNGGTILVYGVK
jgi:hypothetical protein